MLDRAIIVMGFSLSLPVRADTTCTGAAGDHATPPGSGATEQPAVRSCLNPKVARIVGGKSMDMVGGMAVDKAGNAYFAGETKSFSDTTYGDLFVAKMAANGDFKWMVTYGGARDDGIHPHDENTEGDGQSGMIDIDEAGNVYVVGRAESHGGPYAGVVLKVSPEGKLLWSRLYRPQWKDLASASAQFNAVSVHNGMVHVVGVTNGEANIILCALDAATGNTIDRLVLDPSPGYNDRLYGVAVNKAGNAVFATGWTGTSAGLVLRANFVGNKYALAWGKEVPVPRGTNMPSAAIDDAGGLYVVADIHGASTWSELHKYDSETGKMLWAQRYNAGVANDKTQTHVVKVVGEHVFLAGKIGFTGSYTYVDSFGDGFVLLLDRDGGLKREHFFFTGTNPKSFDSVKDVDLVSGNLYAVGWRHGPAVKGEWRDPNDYKVVKHAWTKADRRDFQIREAEIAVVTDKTDESRDGASIAGLKFSADATDYAYFDPPDEKAAERSNDTFFWIFEKYL